MYFKSDRFKLWIEFTEESLATERYLQVEEQLFYAKII